MGRPEVVETFVTLVTLVEKFGGEKFERKFGGAKFDGEKNGGWKFREGCSLPWGSRLE